MKRLLLLAMLAAPSAFAASPFQDRYDHRAALEEVKAELSSQDRTRLAKKVDHAIDKIVEVAAWKLRREGKLVEAKRLEKEWNTQFKGFLPHYVQMLQDGQFGAIGDYAPMSEWLSDVSKRLVELLGQEICDFLRISDLNTINYCLPVVFHIEKVLGPVMIDFPEYEVHFDPFCGVVAYWSTWAACTGATWGTGAFIICTPAGWLVEKFTVKYVAPKVAPGAYKFFWE
jgi:hypothetical protein